MSVVTDDAAHRAAKAAVSRLASRQQSARAAKLAPIFESFDGVSNLPSMRNRIIFPPCTRWLTPGGNPGASRDSMADYYARRAKHIGLVVTEGVYLSHLKGGVPHPDATTFNGPGCLSDWKAVVSAVHAEGGLIVPQIHHVGISTRQVRTHPPHTPRLSWRRCLGAWTLEGHVS